jgi:putative heme-binding domain-containing protein
MGVAAGPGGERVERKRCYRGLAVLWLSVGPWALAAGQERAADPKPAEPAFNHAWTVDELLPVVADLGTGRNWAAGGRVFQAAGCGICHSFSKYWEGNGLAPDLTPVGSKYSRDVILQSIVEPSATINPQFYHSEFTLKDGTVIRGSVLDSVKGKLMVAPVMMAPDVTVEINQADVKSERPSPVSPMPAGLLNGFSKEQILELMAFLDAGGNPDAAIYKK